MRSDNRIRPDDELVPLKPVVLKILGGMSVSTAYDDPELMALKIKMTAPNRRSHMIRFILREIHELRAQRVAKAAAEAVKERERIEARLEARRVKRRTRETATA